MTLLAAGPIISGMRLCFLLFAFILLSANFAHAFEPFTDYQLEDPERERGTFWPQVITWVLPGYDQWYEKQFSAATVYSGIAAGGLIIAGTSGVKNDSSNQSAGTQISQGSSGLRAYLLGNKLYEVGGDLSAYHSFRSAVHTRWAHGKYAFLKKEDEETTDQLMLAPFKFTYLERPTTYLPLGLLALSIVTSSFRGHQFTFSDGFYSPANGLSAGIGEESLFRGYIEPRLMESFDSPFWSNTTSSVLFGAAHIASDDKVPVSQFLFGWYVGWLSQKNNWTLSEGIFIHAWWDTLIFLYDLSDKSSYAKSPLHSPPKLPLLDMSF